jgi:plasmid stabilization system protein ParE
MSPRYTDTARDETNDIFAHIAKDNSHAAAEVAATIEATISRLLAFPRLGSPTNVAGVHMTIARPHPYLIFYSIEDDELVIRNVRHPARRRPPTD